MKCPHCGYEVGTALPINGQGAAEVPQTGYKGLCRECLGWCIAVGGELVKYTPTLNEQAAITMLAFQKARLARLN